jgi:hypothetical protein
MKYLALICILLTSTAHCQVSGTFKISKLSAQTYVEQLVFKIDGQVDVTYDEKASWRSSIAFRESKETRCRYQVEPMAKVRATMTSAKDLLMFKQYEEAGYDILILVHLVHSTGKTEPMFFVRKEKEIVNVFSKEIFQKSFW